MSQKGLTAASVGEVVLPPGGRIRDTNGTVLFQSDPLGGMSYPWYSVPLLQLFTGMTGPSSAQSWPLGWMAAPQQIQPPAPGFSPVVGSPWFAGFLPYVSHPRLYLQTFSQPVASGSTATWEVGISTNNFSAFTSIGTFVTNVAAGQFRNDTFDLTPYLGEVNVGLAIILQSITGSTANSILMQPYGCFLRGSV